MSVKDDGIAIEETVSSSIDITDPSLVDILSLPQPLAVLRKSFDDVESGHSMFYILGTAHVSRKSCEDTAQLIRAIRPELVFVELCPERQSMLYMDRQLKEPTFNEVLSDILSGRSTPFQAIYSWLLAKVGNNLDVLPGEEFRVAVEEAHAIGACVVLGDRPLSITLSRLWGSLSLWEKSRLLGNLLWTGFSMLDPAEMAKEIEKMKESDVLTEAIREIGKDFPSLLEALINERDQYMAYILRQLAGKAVNVVAVVGAGHLEGIKTHWDRVIDIETISRAHVQKSRVRSRLLLVGIAITGVAGMGIVYAWRRRS